MGMGAGTPNVPGSISLTTAGGSSGASSGGPLTTAIGQVLGTGGRGPS
jgi:hypothetical protein